ncbi:hypothetical protein Peur_034192 [Populus x canadensis]
MNSWTSTSYKENRIRQQWGAWATRRQGQQRVLSRWQPARRRGCLTSIHSGYPSTRAGLEDPKGMSS